jgi:hypothetical protein
VIPEFLEPSFDVVVGMAFGDVVDEESTDCSTVVAAWDADVGSLYWGEQQDTTENRSLLTLR